MVVVQRVNRGKAPWSAMTKTEQQEISDSIAAISSFMRDARAPAAGHSTHFNPQHWLLYHMGLY
jgi:hypothetical protein